MNTILTDELCFFSPRINMANKNEQTSFISICIESKMAGISPLNRHEVESGHIVTDLPVSSSNIVFSLLYNIKPF